MNLVDGIQGVILVAEFLQFIRIIFFAGKTKLFYQYSMGFFTVMYQMRSFLDMSAKRSPCTLE